MSWTEERIETLKTMWEAGQTASQIAEALGGVSRNAVIGKAHRLGLQARPSPVRPNDPDRGATSVEPDIDLGSQTESTVDEGDDAAGAVASYAEAPEAEGDAPPFATADADTRPAAEAIEDDVDEDSEDDAEDGAESDRAEPVVAATPAPQPVLRSVGPGGFLRQAPGEQQAPITPAPPRRLVPARPSAEIAGKTSLLELNDKICKWPIGHPGEPDFHFCGVKVNPGFPYCVDHCGHAYQAQLPRRDRRPPPPLPFGGPRVR